MPSNLFVCLMGVGTVFVGLICLILLVTVMSSICRKFEKEAPVAPVSPVVPVRTATGNGAEVIAAISSVIAEEMGTDVSAIRIVSVKRV